MPDTHSQTNPQVSVIMPCLNEELTIGSCIEAARRGIERAGVQGEIIVCDNGSHDRSVAIATEAGARVIHCRTRGYGNALRAGFAAARGEWILMGDADQSYDFAELPRFQREIEKGYDLVMGTRLRGRIEDGAMPKLNRYFGNPFLSSLIRVLFRSGVSDANCGLRAFRTEALKRMDLRTSGMELATEMVIKSAEAGLRIGEIPITLRRDGRDRPPHLRPFSDGWRNLRFMLMMAPNWLFLLPGMILGAAGWVMLIALLPGPIMLGSVSLGVPAMLFGMSFTLLGVYLFLIGIFTKVFAYTEKLGLHDSAFTRLLSGVELEHGLVLAGALIVIGLAGDLWLQFRPSPPPGGDSQSGIRMAIVFTTVLLTGIELWFASFFISILGLSRANYTGKH